MASSFWRSRVFAGAFFCVWFLLACIAPTAHALPPGTNSTGCSSNVPSSRYIEDIIGSGYGTLDEFGFLDSAALAGYTFHPSQTYTPDTFIYLFKYDFSTGSNEIHVSQPVFPIFFGNPSVHIAISEIGYGVTTTASGSDGDLKFLFMDLPTETLSLDSSLLIPVKTYTRAYAKGLRVFVYDTMLGAFDSYTRISGVWTADATFGSVVSASDAMALSEVRDEFVVVGPTGTTLDFYHVTGSDTVDIFYLYSITPSAYSASDVSDMTYDHNDDLIVGVSVDSNIYVHVRASEVFFVPYTQVLMNTGLLDTQGYRLSSTRFGDPTGVFFATAPGSQPNGVGSSGGVVTYVTPLGGGPYTFENHAGSQYAGTGAISNWRAGAGFPSIVYISDPTFDNGTPPGSQTDTPDGAVIAFCADDDTCEGSCSRLCNGPNVPCEVYEWDPVTGCPAIGVPAPGIDDGNPCTTDVCFTGIGTVHTPISGGACTTTVFEVVCPGTCVNGGCLRDDFLCGLDGPTVTPSPTPSASNSVSNTPSASVSPSNTPSISVTSSNTPAISNTASNTPAVSATSSNSPTSSTTSTSSATASNTPAPSATSSNSPVPSSTSSNSPTISQSMTPTRSASATSTVGGICATISSCDDGDECTVDNCINSRGGCVHDYTSNAVCALSMYTPIDPCYPSATNGYCPGPGWPCTQDTRGMQPRQCPSSRYTCQTPSICDAVLGCSFVNDDSECPSVPIDMAPCAAYSCEPSNIMASGTLHGCVLMPTKNTGDLCDHPDQCLIGTTCDSSMKCSGGEPVSCPLASVEGFANVCEGGVCVEREVNLEIDDDDDDDDDDNWEPWVFTITGISLFNLLALLCCCCLLVPAWFYLTQEVEEDEEDDGVVGDDTSLL